MIEVALPSARAAFSTRTGGVSEGPFASLNLGILTDDPRERVDRNRALLAEELGLDPARVVTGWQVHGTEVHRWDEQTAAGNGFTTPGAEVPKVDGHTTRAAGLALMVIAADCLPVALASPSQATMLHCGWRGLASGIVERAVEGFDDVPAAAVGPGIGRCCYEVGEEVLGAFAGLEGVASGRMLDLRAVAEVKLRAAGVSEIEHVDLCTFCREDLFFSHRRDNGITGRQGGLVWRTP